MLSLRIGRLQCRPIMKTRRKWILTAAYVFRGDGSAVKKVTSFRMRDNRGTRVRVMEVTLGAAG